MTQSIASATRFVSLCVLTSLAVLWGGGMGGCSSDKPSDLKIKFVTLEQAERLAAGEHNLIGASKPGTWLDARTKADFDAGHIPGARNLPYERATIDSYLFKDTPILIVYGADYNDVRANGMTKRLMEIFPDHDIRTFDGGIRAWTAAGNELEKTATSAVAPSP